VAGTNIMAGIYTHPHTQLKKSGILHTHTHTQSMRGFPVRQNGDEFEQYPREQVYLPSLCPNRINENILSIILPCFYIYKCSMKKLNLLVLYKDTMQETYNQGISKRKVKCYVTKSEKIVSSKIAKHHSSLLKLI